MESDDRPTPQTAGEAPAQEGPDRATIELAKLKQVDLTRMVLIGVDCLGTYEVADYARIVASGGHPTTHVLEAAAEGRVAPLAGAEFRPACRICEQPVAWAGLPAPKAQPEAGGRYLAMHVLGMAGRILASGSADLLEALGYEEGTPAAGSDDAAGELIAGRLAARDQAFAELRARVHDMDGLLREFSRCVRCHNCMVACPICYCKECVFRGATFDHPPLAYLGWLQRRGAVRLPADTLLFHLTRLNHMAASCVGCGLCSSACPSHLPVAEVFRAVAHEVQALFDYAPGRSLDDELPLATFREDELPGAVR